MTATDELRRLLDERGVGWWNQTDPEPQTVTMARLGEQLIEYHENVNGTMGYHVWNMCDLTPEQAIAATLGSCNCSNSERTGTCTADETEHIECGTIDGRHYDIHIMECSECGHTYEHVNGDYEYCPRCGRRIEVDDG